jgi:hypothetical protein
VGRDRSSTKLQAFKPDHDTKILVDETDKFGPKLQIHLRLFLDENEEPLSAKHFDNTEILLQLSLTQAKLLVDGKKKVLQPFKVPVHSL